MRVSYCSGQVYIYDENTPFIVSQDQLVLIAVRYSIFVIFELHCLLSYHAGITSEAVRDLSFKEDIDVAIKNVRKDLKSHKPRVLAREYQKNLANN